MWYNWFVGGACLGLATADFRDRKYLFAVLLLTVGLINLGVGIYLTFFS